jgi:hypothetical protein
MLSMASCIFLQAQTVGIVSPNFGCRRTWLISINPMMVAGVMFSYDQNRFSGDPDRGVVGVWEPLASADDWTCDSQSMVDFAKWRQIRGRVDTRRMMEVRQRR